MSRKKYEGGSRNLFKDLGLPNAEEHLIQRRSSGTRSTPSSRFAS